MGTGWYGMPDNGRGKKAVDSAALRRSVIDTPKAETATVPSIETSLLWFVAQAASEIAQWGRSVKLRDRQLREFYPNESYFASGLGTVSARNAAFSWTIEGATAITRHIREVLINANQGAGWHDLIVKTSIDLYTQDNGAFWEVVRQTDKPEGVVIGLNHLDAQECYHTGDPLKPVVYRNRKGSLHLLDWYNVVTFAELPAPIERLPGIQFCALTRLLRAAEIMKNITVYEQEKTGGRFNRAVHLVKGISTSEINDALRQAGEQANNMGLLRYIQPLVVGSVDPKADVGHDTIELASMPDGFSKQEQIKLYITIIAMAFLSDYQDFAPLPGGNLGTSTQSEVLHMKSRGKGPALFMGLISNALNFRVLPKVVRFGFEEQDLEADEVQAGIRKVRAEARKIDLDDGVLTLPAARQQALDKGDISKEIFEMLGDEETTPGELVRGGEQPDASGELRETGERARKYTKQAANYRTPGVQATRLCHNCLFFNPGSYSCDIVGGVIRPQDTCDLWQATYSDDEKKRHKKPYKAGDKQEVRQPARAGPFRGAPDTDGEEAEACCSEGACCYPEESNP